MGTDIRAYIEYTITEPDGSKDFFTWYDVELGRNYLLFALMANVKNRSKLQPVSVPKGLPNDVSDGIQCAYENYDSPYLPSWLSLSELREVQRRYHEECDEPDLFLDVVIAAMDVLEQNHTEESRLIFWFD